MTEPAARRVALAQAVHDLYLAIRQGRESVTAKSNGLTQSQVAVVLPLATTDDLPVRALAEYAGVSLPTATRILRDLERQNVVSRRRGDDAREVLTTLTDSGRDRLASARRAFDQEQERTFGVLSAQEQDELIRLLGKLSASMRRRE